MRMTPDLDGLAVFARRDSALLDKKALLAFYSEDLLMSQRARQEWVEPDLRRLP